jgi:hypothetical protein
MTLRSLRGRLASDPGSLGERRREERLRWLADTFPDLPQMSVVDLGGRVVTWKRAPVRPKRVLVVNLEPPKTDVPEWVDFELGDACALPAHITRNQYDLVFSNSVIEHVGGHERRLRFAESVHQLANAYWVQTPYRYFPIEPHWIAPGMQFLPALARIGLGRRWPFAYTVRMSREEVVKQVLWTELIDITQMRHYFPDSVLRKERVFGIPKSLIAYRTGRNDAIRARVR